MNSFLSVEIEALRARLSIRDFFLHHTVREIYENVGQVLSLVSMELAAPKTGGNEKSQMESAGKLVAKTIRDLRLMAKSFSPDADLLQEGGFTEGIKKIIEILYPAGLLELTIKGKQNALHEEAKLIVCSVLLKILILLKNENTICKELVLLFTKSSLKITLRFIYKGVNSEEGQIKISISRFSQDIKLIQGTIEISGRKNGPHSLKLMIPVK